MLLAHSGEGHGWAGPVQPCELHPASVHLPIAFLLGGVALDLYAWWRGRPGLARFATGLLIAGVLAVLTGLLAFFTVPAHTEQAHRLMYWHLGAQAASLVLFAWPAWARWRGWESPPSPAGRLVPSLAAVLLVGAGTGGYMVYHGGAGADPGLLSPELRKGHDHGEGPSLQEKGH